MRQRWVIVLGGFALVGAVLMGCRETREGRERGEQRSEHASKSHSTATHASKEPAVREREESEENEKDEENEKNEKSEKAEERTIALADAPAAVQHALAQLVPAGKPAKITTEEEDGARVYEAEYEKDGAACTVSLDEQGHVLELEQAVKPADLPKGVTDALKRHFEGAKVEKAEAVQTSYYELTVERHGQRVHVKVAANGAILGVEGDARSEKGEQDEDDEEGEGGERGEREGSGKG